jgi:hypothetical protein
VWFHIYHTTTTNLDKLYQNKVTSISDKDFPPKITPHAPAHFARYIKKEEYFTNCMHKELKHQFIRLNVIQLTVAGEATSKSMGSKIKFVVLASWMISPLFKQS